MRWDCKITWREVRNTVKERLLDDSLSHTLNSNRRIKKQTKILNRNVNKYRKNLITHKRFLRLKREVRYECDKSDETDDESGLDLEAYRKSHNKRSKSALKTFLRSCTLTRGPGRPRKTDEKSETVDHKRLGKSPTAKHSKQRTLSKKNFAKYEVRTRAHTSVSELSYSPESQRQEKEFSNRRKNVTEKIDDGHIHGDKNSHEIKCIKKIVKKLISSNDEKELDSEKEELDVIEDNTIVENISEELVGKKAQFDATNSSVELASNLGVLDSQKEDYFNVIDDKNASSSALEFAEICNNDNPLSQEDIFMTSDENNEDTLNCDSGNNSFSDTDFSRDEYGKNSIDELTACDKVDKEIITGHYTSLDYREESIPLDNTIEPKKNGIKFNGVDNAVNFDTEFDIPQSEFDHESSMQRKSLSDENKDSEASEEIPLTAEIRWSQLEEGKLSTEKPATDDGSKLKIRRIERYDKGYEIFSKYQLHKGKKHKTVNGSDNKFMEKGSSSEDEQPVRLRKSSKDPNSSPRKSEDSNRLINREDSVENKCKENESTSENEEHLQSRKDSKACDLIENESQCLNGLIHRRDSLSSVKSNGENYKSLLGDEGQSEDNKSTKEYDLSEIGSYRRNRSLNSSFSSFSHRSCDEDFKNSVKINLLSEIEQRLRDVESSGENRAFHNQSQMSNESLNNETENSSLVSNPNEEDIEEEFIDYRILSREDDAESLESNGSINLSKNELQISNRTSDIEESLIFPKPAPSKRRISISEDHRSLENTQFLKKRPRLYEQSTKKRLESITHERNSQETISDELESTINEKDSRIREREELIASKNVQRTPKKRPRPRNLEEYVATEGLTQDTTKAHFRLKDIDDDDELWIMDVPKTINPKDLEDQVILLGGKSELIFGNDCYKVSSKPSKKLCNISCIFSTSKRKKQYKIANIESKGSIKFRQKFNVIPKTELIPSKVSAVPFPKNLKMRHPLFGASYMDKI